MKLKKFLSTSSFILISTPALAGLGDPWDTVVMCRACPAGTSGNGSATSCTNCTAGTYQDKVGQGECINCGKGRYQNATGQTGCKNCGKGYYCPNEKTVNPIPVDTGYCAKTDKESAQTACASNASSSYPGVKTCNKETCAATSCNDGYYLTGTTCTKCEAGYYCKDSTRNNCGQGKYSEAGWSECKPCKAATGFGSWYNRDSSSYGAGCGNVRRQATAYCNGNNSTKIDADPYTSYEDNTLTCGSGSYCYNGSCSSCHNVKNGSSSITQQSMYQGSCSYSCYSGYPYRVSEGGELVACCNIDKPSGSGGWLDSDCRQRCSGRTELKNGTCVDCNKPSNSHWTVAEYLGISDCSWKCDSGYEEWNGECLAKCSSGTERGVGGKCQKKCGTNEVLDGAGENCYCAGGYTRCKGSCVSTSCGKKQTWDSSQCKCVKSS